MDDHTNNLWLKVVSFDILLLAFKKAARGKRSKPSVAEYEYNLEHNLLELREQLRNGNYVPGRYQSFYVHETKRRLISAAPFGDRVVHHALINIIEPIFERKFIFDSYANRIGKGTHRALDRCTYYMRRFRYVLPLDVRQFFPSIDHEILTGILRNPITDEKVMDLVEKIIASGIDIQRGEYQMICLQDQYYQSQIKQEKVGMQVRSWLEHASHGDTWGLRNALLQEFQLSRQEIS